MTAAAIDGRSSVKISRGVEAQQGEAKQESAQICLTFSGAGAGNDFHDYGLSDGQRSISGDQIREP